MARKHRIPAQHRKDAHDQHRRCNQEVLDAPCEHQSRLRGRRRVDHQDGQREKDTQADQQRDELEKELTRVSLRVGREHVAIDDAKEKVAVEDAKLLPHHGGVAGFGRHV
jgi:hypothetical protein